MGKEKSLHLKQVAISLLTVLCTSASPVFASEMVDDNINTAYFNITNQKLPSENSISPDEATDVVLKFMKENFTDIYNDFEDDTTIVWVYRPSYETVDEFLEYYPNEQKIPVLGLTPVWEGRIETNLGSNIQEGDYALRVAVTESGEIVGFENLKDVLINKEALNYSADEKRTFEITELSKSYIKDFNLTNGNLVDIKCEATQNLELVDLSSFKIENNNLWYDNYFHNEALKVTATYDNGDEFKLLYRSYDEKIVGFYNNKFGYTAGWVGF